MANPYGITDERFWSKVDCREASACWLWRAGLATTGYGAIMSRGQVVRAAHRVAWIKANGRDIPKGYHVHHTCHVRACVNPGHLELLTEAEHGAAHVRERTACRRGHSMADAYVRPDTGLRTCRICASVRSRRYWDAMKAARPPLPERPCCVCERPFRPRRRATATYCGQACRMAAFKARQRAVLHSGAEIPGETASRGLDSVAEA